MALLAASELENDGWHGRVSAAGPGERAGADSEPPTPGDGSQPVGRQTRGVPAVTAAGSPGDSRPTRPCSTYRLQITASFTLRDVAAMVPYLCLLGVDWLYCSPLLQSEPSSDHGYDVIDHGRTDEARGGRGGLAALAAASHAVGRGIMVDIVPNHVGVARAEHSSWWWDVLARGRNSAHAAAFDIDWVAADGRVRIPVLGDGPDELAALEVRDGMLSYDGHVFPIADGTGTGAPRDVHDRQHYELINYRRADAELNYRRFFAVNSLAGIRVERPEVFDASHAEIAHWIDSGWVDGLRVDHVDGLADPAGYLRDLSMLTGNRYTVVEKIIGPGEEVPDDWACAGTTGYDTLALIDRLLVDPTGQGRLDALDTALRGYPADWRELVRAAKRAVTDTILRSEVRRLARLVPQIPAAADAIAELLACFEVYRIYPSEGTEQLSVARVAATRRRPDLADAIAAVAGEAQRPGTEFATRLQQTSGSVMAKGVEDCAFYRYPRLTSLTEVGGDPSQFAIGPEAFHLAQARRLARWPDGMTALSTHDTKRGEDVRARIAVLSEIPDDWAAAVTGWLARTRFPDGVLGNLLLQTAFGAWPIERERLHAYAEKAAREAGTSTQWIDPDQAFERRMHALVDACYDDAVINAELAALADRVRPSGWSNSLSAKLIQLTLPGAPDVYQGTELWENSLVDPDNRRPYDWTRARTLLARLDAGWQPDVDAGGAAKLLVVSTALRARRSRPELFRSYTPLRAAGPAAEHAFAFDRGGAITMATRLPCGLERAGGWRHTVLALPAGGWRDALTGRTFEGGDMPIRHVLHRYPAALLLPAA